MKRRRFNAWREAWTLSWRYVRKQGRRLRPMPSRGPLDDQAEACREARRWEPRASVRQRIRTLLATKAATDPAGKLPAGVLRLWVRGA